MTPYLCLLLLIIMGLSSVTLQQQDPNAPGEEENAVTSEIVKSSKPGPLKPWTKYRAKARSTRKVVYSRKNIAVVEYDRQGTLINCEQLTVTNNEDLAAALKSLEKIKTQTEVDPPTLMTLMDQCRPLPIPKKFMNNVITKIVDPIAILESDGTIIVPGTKWCGGGDYGKTYYDIGVEESVDRCCRNHDHCPTTIGSLKKQFNITNTSEKTLLDCACDKGLYDCLKEADSALGDSVGGIYFDVLNGDLCQNGGANTCKDTQPIEVQPVDLMPHLH